MKSIYVAAAAVVAAAFLAPGAATAAPVSTVDYVALGDSYASGLGAGGETGTCKVSTGAYATLWAAAAPDVVSLTQKSCAGATTADVATQIGALNDKTDLVTVTIGGNDLALLSAVRVCTGTTPTPACEEALSKIRDRLAELPGRLAGMFQAVKTAAPKAKVAVLGYPLPFEGAETCSRVPLPKAVRDFGDLAVTSVNDMLRAQAAPGVTYVDVTRPFAGHGVCSATPWIIGVEGLSAGTTLHPSAQGQTQGYLAALTAAVGTPQEFLAGLQPPASPSPSASPAASPSPTNLANGGNGGGLPVTGVNVWWLVGAGLALLLAGAILYRTLRPRRIEVVSG
ncbi:hypothetical protein Val02_78830 [Virgisporangium aliadipatigenens]|uniref:SGNH hydrolase-type esterase domain-containing protein n=1 Tax=Virgisporangium aliadipatigenens TaxID=741659 RepID=A0A8J4DWC8_9ACTN|nr:SGNH/GDSL hydrolase family protein [Virgisporangium aliadipatigenens]GIJ50997.1 hypothetical protein Val02_78830 [Virgisporangium aliadipatigenens]